MSKKSFDEAILHIKDEKPDTELHRRIHPSHEQKHELKQNLSQTEVNYKQKLNNFERHDFISSASIASNKIVELSKQLREKNSEIESLKSKYAKLELEFLHLNKQEKPEEKINAKNSEVSSRDESEFKKLQETNQILKSKLAESRNANLLLKNDIKLTKKWLKQEIGESFESLQILNKVDGSWRGRAQIIYDLQMKNNELKEKLKSFQHNETENTLLNKKTDKFDSTLKENENLKDENIELKRKYDLQKARYKVLQTDYSSLKIKFDVLEKQFEQNECLIANLTNQLSSNRNANYEVVKQKDIEINKIRLENEKLLVNVNQLEFKLENMNKELTAENQMENNTNTQSINIDNCEQSKYDKNRFIDLINELNNRLEQQRAITDKIRYEFKIEKQKTTKLKSTVAQLEIEQNISKNSYLSVSKETSKPDNNYKDQLELAEERIKALETRLQIEQHERKIDFQHFSKILLN